jgi:hypothetical protein
MPPSVSSTPSPTSAHSKDADLGSQIGVTEFSYIHSTEPTALDVAFGSELSRTAGKAVSTDKPSPDPVAARAKPNDLAWSTPRLREHATNSDEREHDISGKSPTTFATPPASSLPAAAPQDVHSTVLVTPFDHGVVRYPKHSKLNDITILVPAAAFSASSTSTSSSTPLLDASIANPTAATELVLMEHTRCSTLGLYQYAYVPVMAITSSATASDQDAKIDIPAAEHQQVQHEGRLLSACSLGTPNQRLVTSLMFKAINTSLTSSIVVHQLCLNTNAGNTH